MDEYQRSLRRSANQAFMESLDQLAVSLWQEGKQPKVLNDPQPAEGSVSTQPIDLRVFEEAAADIEQFMQSEEE